MRSQTVTIGWLLGSVAEVISRLLLLLLASPPELANMFQYTDPGASFSWPDQMIRDGIAVANASGNTSHFVIENSAGNLSSDFHSLMEGRSLSDFKTAGGNQPYSDGSRGNNGSFTAVTLTYERSVLDVLWGQRLSVVELSYTSLGPDSISPRCSPYQDETRDDLCAAYKPRFGSGYKSDVVVNKKFLDANKFLDATWSSYRSNYTDSSPIKYGFISSESHWMNGSYTRDCPIIEKKHWSLDCKKTDPRRHIVNFDDNYAYKKQHMILIDSGNSMGALVKDEFNRPPNTSYLNVAQEIAAEYSKTLPPEDEVNVFSFNASGAHPLQFQKFHGAPDRAVVKFLLSASIANADISPGTERSNLSSAILDVIPKFQLDKSSLNVVLVFSDGNFEPLSVYPKLLAALQIRVMLYILPHNSEPDQNMVLSTNLPVLSEANGYFEMLNATSIANPLYWIHGYFSYLSHFDSVLCKSESWGDMYLCVFRGPRQRTMSMYRALGNDDMLVGVKGIDVKYEDITSELQMLLKHYVNEGAHDVELFQVVLRIHSCNHPIDYKYCKDRCYFSNIGSISNIRSPSQISDHICNYSEYSLTSSNNNVTLFMKPSVKFILIFMVLSVIVVLITRWIKQQNFVFLMYNRGSSTPIFDNDLSSDSDLDSELNPNKIDPSASIFFNNRDVNIMWDSSSSRGSSGIVSKIMLFGVECAMKMFHPYAKNDFRIEATTLIKLDHPHIVKFYCAFGDSAIVMELMDKDLFSFIASLRDHNNNYNLPLNVALEIMMQIAKGMSYLHECGIAHQDLKSLNILLKLEGQVHDRNFKVTSKVADFGNARAFDPNSPEGLILFPHIHIGTRAWRAPELSHPKRTLFSSLFGMYPYVMLKPLDIYAFGIICYELIMGELPIQASHSLRFPNGVVTLVEDCCHTNPLRRPKFDDICQRLLELKSSLAFNE